MGEMQWRSHSQNAEKILYLRHKPDNPWVPYTQFPALSKPDYDMPGGSKGWATYQFLLKAKWKLLPSEGVKILKDGGDRDG